MERISPPFIELGFYYHNIPSHLAFKQVAQMSLSDQGQYIGKALISQGQGIRDTPFVYFQDENPQLVELSASQLDETWENPNLRLGRIYVKNVIGTVRQKVEWIQYSAVSPEASIIDRHPIAIYTDGSMFDVPQQLRSEKNKQDAKTAGRRVYERFLMIVKHTQPSYAAITIEWSLECPTDLRLRPYSLIFNSCYFSKSFFAPTEINRIKEIYSGAYLIEIGEGIYTSINDDFCPEPIKLKLDYEMQEKMFEELGSIIGTHAPNINA